jgi:hypothetical protein
MFMSKFTLYGVNLHDIDNREEITGAETFDEIEAWVQSHIVGFLNGNVGLITEAGTKNEWWVEMNDEGEVQISKEDREIHVHSTLIHKNGEGCAYLVLSIESGKVTLDSGGGDAEEVYTMDQINELFRKIRFADWLNVGAGH